jgi:hypothetical protein
MKVNTLSPNVVYAQVIAEVTFGFADHDKVMIPVAVLMAILSLLNICQFSSVILLIDKVV